MSMSLTRQHVLDLEDYKVRPALSPIVQNAVDVLASAHGTERGAIYTRQEVVEFILDLVGYTTDHPLHEARLLEPSVGEGDFLVPAVKRLLASYATSRRPHSALVDDLAPALTAVELHSDSLTLVKEKVLGVLGEFDVTGPSARQLLDAWLSNGDFLLTNLPRPFTHVVGNPPYVRQELVPDALLQEYRRRYESIYDRADLYVPFIERSLTSLEPGGVVGFICTDRWMKNRYGKRLRQIISEGYHLRSYVDMVGTDAFHSDVTTYPAITVIAREKAGPTRLAGQPKIDRDSLRQLAELMNARQIAPDGPVAELAGVVDGADPWLLQSADQLQVVRRLEQEFPMLEETGCQVGIGVATGADRVFVAPFEELDVEPSRKLPLVMTKDIASGVVKWRGFGVVNPFEADGQLVDLAAYPRLRRYLEHHRDTVARRNCATRHPNGWYRTIDRIYPELATTPKLLIPDIKGEANVVYESGKLYPHHNLYHVTSKAWDLRALQAVLRSSVAKLFVSTYSTRMRGGYLRFQAQYLRRIRIPQWDEVPDDLRRSLTEAAKSGDTEACNRAVFVLYRLTQEEQAAIGGSGAQDRYDN
ncbi:MAG: modification methylase PaeR7I [Parcubacteria group bacterium 21-54-25]|nr:MAG: modification methylase PaeR7I [Parcubacteria group bacterium 21-54-25]